MTTVRTRTRANAGRLTRPSIGACLPVTALGVAAVKVSPNYPGGSCQPRRHCARRSGANPEQAHCPPGPAHPGITASYLTKTRQHAADRGKVSWQLAKSFWQAERLVQSPRGQLAAVLLVTVLPTAPSLTAPPLLETVCAFQTLRILRQFGRSRTIVTLGKVFLKPRVCLRSPYF
jgi:hypothetical protein